VTLAATAAVTLEVVALTPMHGIGGRQDLPLPFEFVVAGAATAVVASFLVLSLAWRTARPADPGRPVGERLTRIVDSTGLRWTVRGVGLAVALFMGMALLFGQDLLTNPIFGFVYVWVWVGLVPLSLLLGPVWRTLNPLRSIHLLACRLRGADPTHGVARLPDWVGRWPAAIGLFGFVWLELVAPDRVTIPILLFWLTLYTVIMLFGSVPFGRRWFSAADPFETYAVTMAKMSPWGRDSGGQILLRSPLANLATFTPKPGMVVFLAVLIGSTGYDGFSNSSLWVRWTQNSVLPTVLVSTLGLSGFIAIVFISYTAACLFAGRLTHSSRRALPGLFVHSLVPIALGYVTAHYLTLLILEGQRVFITSSDPLSRGWDLFGTASWDINASIMNYPGLIGSIQTAAVVLGHILGVILAHDRALALFPRRAALIRQLPLLTVMVCYTIGALLLLFTE
jgi:hypothetical protein